MDKTWALFQKDLLLEIRQQYSFYGILLYVGATIFVMFLSIDQPGDHVWNGLFWIIQLFICINAVAKSFLQESKSRMLYFQSITGPKHFIFAKLLFNSMLMLVMSGLTLALYSAFLGNPAKTGLVFLGVVFLGGWSLSFVFTFLAAIAAKAQQNAAIMPILGFPIIIPQIIMLIKISNFTFTQSASIPLMPLFMLVVLDILVVMLSYILFPFLWKD